ncbi:hypothetical protein HBI56_120060 [Parastagonospora nodorum]|uniref:Uncharacterized protein n=1 Tax=Phaeosphaeria nodorum (strain SN15 / ATCC MYA-4574 / FGSC 10173) TaxID=321614 RepID=A0A7U2I597_PHANO|nr:hypothetical protein HBH53_098800 [Parastagonospora nodorum]QRD02345.1 hypothetical protein JI435_417810 [Parastagonospora nodorum SN15]KAH4067174.1 hypothetical protein HBH50_136550 [Parastagonospora nodorum]KAH4107755.1 hypothetical protein HBH46_050180 [Parastagonospora nodorum]KAH4140047.1 hypothetical protein HBH45_082600 [Parastagonospora nodorum]
MIFQAQMQGNAIRRKEEENVCYYSFATSKLVCSASICAAHRLYQCIPILPALSHNSDPHLSYRPSLENPSSLSCMPAVANERK